MPAFGDAVGDPSFRPAFALDGSRAHPVRDEGAGLPADFDLRKAKGLGMRIINSFGEQLNAKVWYEHATPEQSLCFLFPCGFRRRQEATGRCKSDIELLDHNK